MAETQANGTDVLEVLQSQSDKNTKTSNLNNETELDGCIDEANVTVHRWLPHADGFAQRGAEGDKRALEYVVDPRLRARVPLAADRRVARMLLERLVIPRREDALERVDGLCRSTQPDEAPVQAIKGCVPLAV